MSNRDSNSIIWKPKITQKKSQSESVDVNHRFSAITFLICDKYYRSVRVCCGVGSSLRVFWSVYERLNWMRACFLLGCFCSCWAGLGTDCHACFSWKILFDQGCVTSPDRVCVFDCISTWERVALGHMDLNVHFLCCMDLFYIFTCSLLGEYTVKNIKKNPEKFKDIMTGEVGFPLLKRVHLCFSLRHMGNVRWY